MEDGGADFQPQPYLYADVKYYIEVHWSMSELKRGVVMVSAQAQLVDPAGVALRPQHLIEPPTQVLMLGQTLRVLQAESAN